MFEVSENIESYYNLNQSIREKMRAIDDMADQLGDLLDWNLTVDFQIINQSDKSSLYAVSIIAGEVEDEGAPVFFTTASADEALIRLQVYLDLMEKFEINNLARSVEYYQQALDKLAHYYNEECEDILHQIVLEGFFAFNESLVITE
ncbi:hypothetical protein [Fastidiosibacter lacustris]|uniref:hypothetical protein n=1 Tax=Fastidiosibacter lacustris TaxID=2056695 RepID=UPI000E34C993|nr:hypothetical protein [Fastidiosibacter lacustris]